MAILAGLHILTRLSLRTLLREVPDPVRHPSEVFWFVIIYAFLIIMGDCQIRTLLSFETKDVEGAPIRLDLLFLLRMIDGWFFIVVRLHGSWHRPVELLVQSCQMSECVHREGLEHEGCVR